jgi:DNA-directed RNA polymerase specialized sigma24 family protein
VAQVHAEGETPSEQVAGAEILQQYMKRLTPQERYLQEQRDLGREWEDIAAELKESPEALRKRLERAKERVARELGLDRHLS